MTQGSLDGPSLHGRLSAFTGRCSQSLVPATEALLQIYTDDPILTMIGCTARAHRLLSILTMGWLIMGYTMAFHKAQLGRRAAWVGYQIEDTKLGTSIMIKESFLDELRADTTRLMRKNIIGIKELRSYTGRANHVAGLMFIWRPFLDALWAATATVAMGHQSSTSTCKTKRRKPRKSKAPPGHIWTKQVISSIRWIAYFLADINGPLHREWSFDAYLGTGPRVVFVVDASPYGLGGILVIGMTVVAYFAVPLSDDDCRIHGFARGDCKGQQAWECLAVLVALKLWRNHWHDRRSTITIKGDNMSALSMASRLKVGPSSRLIGQELALIYWRSHFEPKVEHIPGISNVFADALSRLSDPSKNYAIPEALRHAERHHPPPRPNSYYLAMTTW